jgi:FkbM family methyltransferase
MRILNGPLKGKRWIKGSHNISVLLGVYERLQSKEFHMRSVTGNIFWDLGAHVGYYSLLFLSANPRGHVYAFEPAPKNAKLFLKHMEINQIKNFDLFPMAASDVPGCLSFYSGKTSVAGRIAEGGDMKVNVVRLSDWVREKKIAIPHLIKMDIEGEEGKVLHDIEMILNEFKPVIFLSTHGQRVHDQCISLLKKCNYSLKPLDNAVLEKCRELMAY